MSSEHVTTNGVRLRTLVGGDGPAVVLLHGWCGSAHTWRHVVPPLIEGGLRVVVPDMRGFGESDKPDSLPNSDGTAGGGYDAENEAHDVAGLLDHLGIERAHVVGHDTGAPVALAFSGIHPGRTLSVGYIDAPLVGYNHVPTTAFSTSTRGGSWQFGLNWVPGLPETLYTGHETELVRHVLSSMSVERGVVDEEMVELHAAGLRGRNGVSGSVGRFRAILETAAQIRRLGDSGAFATPVLAVGGSHGVTVTAEQMNLVSANVTAHVFGGCGHLVPEERPLELVRVLLDFIAAGRSANGSDTASVANTTSASNTSA